MDLIQTLQESSGHPVGDLKKILTKDKRVSQVLQKGLDLEDIEDKSEFLKTLKFLVLNNRNVLNFVEGRDYIKTLNVKGLKKLRELQPSTITQKDLDDLVQFVSDILREYSYVERSGMSTETRKELLDWVNSSGRYYDLSRHARQELESLPNIRPTRPTLLYRGLLFSSYDLRERKRYDGTLEVGAGLKFLRSIREGSRVVDLEWDRASSWSTSKETAMQFARFGPANSNFSATLQWLGREGHIDGDLGFVISTLAQPEDVIIDVNRMVTSAHIKHGDEGEMILKPGTYRCRVSTKLSKKGEEDPIASENESVQEAISASRSFVSSIDLSQFESLIHDDWGLSTVDVERILKSGDIKDFKLLSSPEIKKESLQGFENLKSFYDEHLKNLDVAELQNSLTNPENTKIVEWIINLKSLMSERRKHSDFKSEKNTNGAVKSEELSASQFRDTIVGDLSRGLTAAMKPGRFTDRQVAGTISILAKRFANQDVQDLHRKGSAAQDEVIDDVLEGFFKAMGIDEPADREQALKIFKSNILAAERNARLISTLYRLKHDAEGKP